MNERKVRVALCQRVAKETPEQNLEETLKMIDACVAEHPKVDVIAFPEFNLGIAFGIGDVKKFGQTADGPYVTAVREKAREHRVNIIPGTFVELFGKEKGRNTALFIDRDGELRGRYSKVHMFDVMGESAYIEPGDGPVVIDADFGRVGIEVCYDLRFPELMRCMCLKGAEIVFVPAAFPGGNPLPPRTDQWDVLVESGAMTNAVWVCACNMFGNYKTDKAGVDLFGRSRIVDPWGITVAQAGGHEDIVYSVLDLNYGKDVSARMGLLDGRRPECYGAICEPNKGA